MSKNFLSIFVVFLLLIDPSSALALFGKKSPKIVEWQSPVPHFSDLNIDLKTVAELIGDGKMLLSLHPQNIDLWTKGKVKSYKNVRFASAMTLINQPADVVRDSFDMESFVKSLKHIKDSGNHRLFSFIQEYDLGEFTLRASFCEQVTFEENGDISLLLHYGDVDAGVKRFEFLPISRDKTLLVMTHWQDLESASFFYKLLIKAMPNSTVAFLPNAASFVVQDYKDTFSRGPEIDIVRKNFRGKDDIPIYSTHPKQIGMLQKLVQIGTPTFVHPIQNYSLEGGQKELQLSASVQLYPVPISKTKSLLLDFTTLPEYFDICDKALAEDIPGGKRNHLTFKFPVGIIKIKFNSSFDAILFNDDIMYFGNPKGDGYFVGAEELVEVRSDSNHPNTMEIFTSGIVVGKKAPWIVKYLEKSIPFFNQMLNVGNSLGQVESQLPWLIEKVKEGQTIATAHD